MGYGVLIVCGYADLLDADMPCVDMLYAMYYMLMGSGLRMG